MATKNLSQAISESLEIEKCSICLEKLVNTVLFWPCTHWFCSNCVSTLYRNAQAEKVTCPLCKTVTSRRSVLSFQDKQKEYADYLQTLIGAVSLDLGFDITSYTNNSRYKASLENEQCKSNKTRSSSPKRKAVPRNSSKKIRGESNFSSNKNRRITRSSDLKTASNFETSKVSPILLPETPINQREEKVKEWLATTRFSQVNSDSLAENVVVDIHKSELESPEFSEDQLLSITQTCSKPSERPVQCFSLTPKDYPSDSEDIRRFNEAPLNNRSTFISRPTKNVITPEEQFDHLLSDRKKRRQITTTYGSKNQYNSIDIKKRSFIVDSDLFLEEPKNEVRTDKSSSNSLEDFSSGSGEVWTGKKKSKLPRITKNLKKKPISKSTKRQTWQRGLEPIFNSTNNLNCKNQDRNITEMLLKDKVSTCEKKVDTITSIYTDKVSKVKNCDKDIMQEIRNDWFESQDTEAIKQQNVMAAPKLQDNVPKCKRPCSVNLHNQNTPIKHNNERSPGWSRIKTTKKEFHMTEKKKLNLKTFGKKSMAQSTIKNIGASLPTDTVSNPNVNKDCKTPINMQKTRLTSINLSMNKSSLEERCLSSLNIDNIIDHSVIGDHDCIIKKGSRTIGNFINNSFTSSSSGSPFNGFETPNKNVIKPVFLMSVKKDENKILSPENTECKEQNQVLIKTKSNIIVIESTENSNKTSEVSFSKETSHINEVSDVINEGIEEVVNHEHRLNSSELRGSGKFNLTLQNPERSSKSLENLQEKTLTDWLVKKRDRDSGIHNESIFDSPVRKRICKDAEVQTSPGRMQSFVKDILKTMLGSEAENIVDKTLNISSKILHNNSCLGGVPDKSPTAVKTSTQNKCPQKSLSQSSDKENIEIFNREFTSEKFLNDSDLVLGTEDHLPRHFSKNSNYLIDDKNRQLETQTTKNNSNISENQIEMSTDDFVFGSGLVVDPDAMTQPYKTPIVPKQKLIPSSSNLYSAVSNPTDSEFKKAETIFLQQRDEIYPDETPKVPLTPWNNSGINKLEGLSMELEINMVKSTSQIVKENKSRRHLDFDEDSNDMFEAIATKKDGNIECNDGAKNDENITKNHYSIFTEIGTQPNNDEKSKHSLESDNIANESPSKSRTINGFNEIEESSNNNPSKVFNEFVDDYIVEATPRVPQIAKEQVSASKKPQEKSTSNKLILSQPCESSFSEKEISREDLIENEPDHDDLTSTVNSKETENKIVADEVAVQTEEIQLEQYCFASSLLNSKQTHVLMRVLHGLAIPYSKTVGPHVSHLVVGTTNGRTQNTYKFLYAMALHRPVIRYDWVEAVIASGETQTLEPYLALDPSGECGVVRAKKDKDRHLLQDFAIHVYNVNVRVIQKEQLEELISLCGGTVVTSLHQFSSVSPRLYKVIILAEPVDTSTQADWREKYGAAELSIDWLYNSIGRYRVVPLGQYMIEPNGAVTFLLHQGYPEQLIFDPPTQVELAL